MSNLLEHDLSRSIEQDNSIKSVSKELFNKQDIDLKTELSHNEINHITRLRFMKESWDVARTDVLIDSFLRLRVSKERKSRKEFIDALQTENRSAQPNPIMRLLGGGNNQP